MGHDDTKVEEKGFGDVIYKLKSNGQEHILSFWDELDTDSKEHLVSQVSMIDFPLIKELHEKHIKDDEETASLDPKNLEPAECIDFPSTDQQISYRSKAKREGEEQLINGKVAVFIVAGGQASRLGIDGPKGCFGITPVKGKSLFQVHSEKIIAMQKRYGSTFPLYIMTSEANHEETKAFFEKNDFFGLEEVHFFKQGMLPALDSEGKLILSKKDEIFMNPDGHGGCVQALKESGALDHMKSKGIERIFYMQVDNPLVKVLDPVFIGYHVLEGSEMSTKVVKKAYPEEKVGVLAKSGGKTTLIEYSSLPDGLRNKEDSNGGLLFNAGNIAVHCIDVGLVERAYDASLPLHKAFKAIPYLGSDGNLVKPDSPNAYKFERFIFDILEMCNKTCNVFVERSREFAPVKNKEGKDSPESSRKIMSDLYRSWLKKAGYDIPESSNVEISPKFASDPVELKRKLKERTWTIDDIENIYLG